MELNPAIPDRTTEELLDIIESPDQWRPEVVTQAQMELRERGFSDATQELRRQNLSKFQRRINTIKGCASYTKVEKILIILFGPILAFIFFDLFLFRPGEGYKRKNRQGVLFLLMGIALWIIIFASIFN